MVVSGHKVGDTVTTSCKEGYRLVGSEVSRLVEVEEGGGRREVRSHY